MYLVILYFLIPILIGITTGFLAGRKVHQKTIPETTVLSEIHANYYAIARMEKAIWNGTSFHSSGTHGRCMCNSICHPETFYIPVTQDGSVPGNEEWRDREGE